VMLRFAHWRSARIRTTTRAFATRAQRRRIDNGIIQLKRYGQYDPELHDHLQHQDLVNTVNIVQNNHGSVTRQKKKWCETKFENSIPQKQVQQDRVYWNSGRNCYY